MNRDEASGTREAFKKIVMGDEAVRPLGGRASRNRPSARRRSAFRGRHRLHLGRLRPAAVHHYHVKALVVDGVVPSEKTVATQEYPIARTLHFFTEG